MNEALLQEQAEAEAEQKKASGTRLDLYPGVIPKTVFRDADSRLGFNKS